MAAPQHSLAWRISLHNEPWVEESFDRSCRALHTRDLLIILPASQPAEKPSWLAGKRNDEQSSKSHAGRLEGALNIIDMLVVHLVDAVIQTSASTFCSQIDPWYASMQFNMIVMVL
jgi:hypothetical protein